MPSLSIYVNDTVYLYMAKSGETPSTVGKQWIQDEYDRRQGVDPE